LDGVAAGVATAGDTGVGTAGAMAGGLPTSGTPAACPGAESAEVSATASAATAAAARPLRLPRAREISDTGTHALDASLQTKRYMRLILACSFIG
jgi:hypothetical protein